MKWAHLLCAMWIPEVSLGNVTFQEPVQDVEKVPKTRWKLVSPCLISYPALSD
jgi:NuA3 HAT complex component NTO1